RIGQIASARAQPRSAINLRLLAKMRPGTGPQRRHSHRNGNARSGSVVRPPAIVPRMLHAIRHALTRVGEFTTHPAAFAVVAAYALAWLVFRRRLSVGQQ